MNCLQISLCIGLIVGVLAAPFDSGDNGLRAQPTEARRKPEAEQSPFVKRVLKLTRALRAIITLDPEVEEEMRSAAAARARAASSTQRMAVERLGDEKPRDTWFGLIPQISASGSSWFPIATSFRQDKDGASSVLLPISPVHEEPTTPPSKDAFRSVEMPDPDATSWFGVPEEAVENRRPDAIRTTGRWNSFHDAGESDMNFGDYGTQLNVASVAHRLETLDVPREDVLQNSEMTRYGKPITNSPWSKKGMQKFEMKKKWPRDHSKAQPQSDVHNEIDVGDNFFHKNVLPAPNAFQAF